MSFQFDRRMFYGPVGRNVTVTINMKNYSVRLIALPNLTSESSVTMAAWFYCILFMVGLCGNSSVLTALYQMRGLLMKSKDNTFIYIMVLCFVDLMVILSLPMATAKMLFGHWVFGGVLCKFYWVLESAGKVMSAFILTALSFDRYLGICQPTCTALRSRKAAIIILLVTVSLATFVLVPLPYESTVDHRYSRILFLGGIPTRFYRSDCVTFNNDYKMEWNRKFQVFTVSIFFAVFVFPALCLSIFYLCILRRICTHARSIIVQSSIPVRRVTKYVAALLGFHFSCWTPYWIAMLTYAVFQVSGISDNLVFVMYFIHALPFVNSSFNWIFYALLNSQFRDSYSHRSSMATSRAHSVIAASRLHLTRIMDPASGNNAEFSESPEMKFRKINFHMASVDSGNCTEDTNVSRSHTRTQCSLDQTNSLEGLAHQPIKHSPPTHKVKSKSLECREKSENVGEEVGGEKRKSCGEKMFETSVTVMFREVETLVPL